MIQGGREGDFLAAGAAPAPAPWLSMEKDSISFNLKREM